MEMFLAVLALSLLGAVVSAALFAAATREAPRSDRRPRRAAPERGESRFFAGGSPLPTEGLLLDIERHVRLERAAAEAFLDAPTRESLHRATPSPLMAGGAQS